MPKVELDKLIIAHSPLTDSIFAGVPLKEGVWGQHKKNVTNEFIACVISRWENKKEVIQSGVDKWEITVKKLNK